jgi:hypothetical protein
VIGEDHVGVSLLAKNDNAVNQLFEPLDLLNR